jgi:serine/threonine protein kinase
LPKNKNNEQDDNLSPDGRPLDSFCPKCGLKVSKPTLPGRLTGYMFDLVKCKCMIETNEGATSGRLYNLNSNFQDATFASLGTDSQIGNQVASAAPQVEKGSIIGGAYSIIEMIGRGGMGEVYLAEHTTLKKHCALKLLPPAQVTNKTWKRFEQEAKTVAKLDHVNIVKVTDLGIHKGYLPFYAMEFVEGETLAERLHRAGPFPLGKAIEIFLQVLDGVDYAHRAGVIHRDIKPGNIMLATNPAGGITVKILDFGLAKLTSHDRHKQSLTTIGEIFGSPLYMSPEQCTGEKIDNRSDIYSIGCSLFECLTGTPPFTDNMARAIVKKHQEEAAPSLEEASGSNDFSEAMEIVMAKLLRKNPVERYQTCRELSDDLKRVAKGEKVQPFYMSRSAPAETLSERESLPRTDSKERSQRLISIAAIAASALAVLCIGGIWYANGYGSHSAKLPLEKIVEKPEGANATMLQTISKATVPSATNTEYYSKPVKREGHHIWSFTFPSDISIGTLYVNQEKQDMTKPVLVDTPSQIVFAPNASIVDQPNYWKRFRPGELFGLKFNAAFTPDQVMQCLQLVPGYQSLQSLQFPQVTAEETMSQPMQDQLSKMKSLIDFSCEDGTLSENDLAQMPWLGQLKNLSLKGYVNIDPVLEKLGPQSRLACLNLLNCGLTEKGFSHIAALPDLTILTIGGGGTGDKDLAALSHSQTLTLLNINGSGCHFNKEWAETIQHFKSLKQLELGLLTKAHAASLRALNIKGPIIDYAQR